MLKSLIAVPLLASSVLLGAAALDGAPPAPTWWNTPHEPQAGPSDGVVPGILDGTWWKLNVKAKGYTVDPETGAAAPGSFSTTAYMYLSANLPADGGGGTPAYNYAMYTETAPGLFSNEYGDTFLVDGLDANSHHALTVNTFMGFDTVAQAVAANHTGKLTIKVDGEGALKSAKLKTLAGEVADSTLDTSVPGSRFHGSLKITGKTIDPEDLPFEL
jgi:hypothetical protein